MVNCIHCGKELIPLGGRKKINPKRKYCNKICSSRDASKRQYSSKKAKILRISNPDLYKKLVLKNYYENKEEWASRTITNRLLKRIKSNELLLKKICKNCGSSLNLEIHHEIYPTKYPDIIESILTGKIYYLCRRCHSNITNDKKRK